MSGFKLIAIRLFERCNERFVKNLKIGEIYQFYQNYNFIVEGKSGQKKIKDLEFENYKLLEIESIEPLISEIDLYSNKDTRINISAVVGKNGSGKSTILELLYLVALCLSKNQSRVNQELKKIRDNVQGSFIETSIQHLEMELFYETDESEIRSIKFEAIKLDQNSSKIIESKILHYTFKPKREILKEPFDLSDFCYSIALNYSLYGLNDVYTPWLKPLFHKNDGYQVPLVINPYRTKGNIDIKVENDLSNYRIIQNIVESTGDTFELINGKLIAEIKFKLDFNNLFRISFNNDEVSIARSKNEFKKINKKSIYHLINRLIEGYNDNKENRTTTPKLKLIKEEDIINFDSLTVDKARKEIFEVFNNINDIGNNKKFRFLLDFLVLEYIIKKVFKIYLQYVENPKLCNEIVGGSKPEYELWIGSFSDLEQFTNDLIIDNSHRTLKLRQMLFLRRSDLLYRKITKYLKVSYDDKIFGDEQKEFYDLEMQLDLELLRNYSKEIKKNGAEDLETIPGGVFTPKIKYLPNSQNANEDKELASLSSGELQNLFSIHTVLYHLRNIDSVHKSGSTPKIQYRNVNLIFDEIELYFHPDFQKIFIKELLRNIKNLSIPNIKNINIIFSTHSPFILSDIPSSNILRLDAGSLYLQEKQTFGANIHDLLANDFFLNDGFMGDFAKEKIQEVIDNLKKDKKYTPKNKLEKHEIQQMIELIGEPFLKDKLMAMFEQKFKETEIYDIEIEKLKAKIVKYETIKNNTNDSNQV